MRIRKAKITIVFNESSNEFEIEVNDNSFTNIEIKAILQRAADMYPGFDEYLGVTIK